MVLTFAMLFEVALSALLMALRPEMPVKRAP
jgi:hypothetical protein